MEYSRGYVEHMYMRRKADAPVDAKPSSQRSSAFIARAQVVKRSAIVSSIDEPLFVSKSMQMKERRQISLSSLCIVELSKRTYWFDKF